MYKISYTGDGATCEFSFAFPFFQESDVRVAIDNQILTGAQYDVDANDSWDGGTVTLSTPPSDGAVIDIFRQISLERIVDYQPTAKINPGNLNTDFNFILAAFRDFKSINIDLAEWKNVHDNVLYLIQYTATLIEDRVSGGGTLGLYKNLLGVLDGALPKLINDYGSVADAADAEISDDYGIL